MLNKEVRVRFAPSPTGYLHIGGIRTALYNWLFARNKKGVFALRIEDTDRERSKDEFTGIIIEAFKWLGLTIDEGPYYQSERTDIYRQYAYQLLEQGMAYKCRCTPEDIEARKKQKSLYKYDAFCKGRKDTGSQYAIRFIVPDGNVKYTDIVSGDIMFNNGQFEDFVILRSNGMPTYNFAVVIDDALMNITHIIRGDDHISNTPKQILLYQALGFGLPEYCHLPMILGQDGKRLSKRYGATSVEEFMKMGFLPDALLNYLARLGWGHGDQELFTLKELIDLFDLKKLSNSSAVFDMEKLEWINAQHLKDRPAEDLIKHLKHIIKEHPFYSLNSKDQHKIIDLYKPRSRKLMDLLDHSAYLYTDNLEYDQKLLDKFLRPVIRPALLDLIEWLCNYTALKIKEEDLNEIFKSLVTKHSIKMLKLAQAVRVALTGKGQSPGLFEVIDVLGRNRTLERLNRALKLIKEDDQ